MRLPLLVVVTGMPSSGKTTVAEALARELRLPLSLRSTAATAATTTAAALRKQAMAETRPRDAADASPELATRVS